MSSNTAKSQYKSVCCAAWAVPTIPFITGAVGDPDGPGYVSGEYIGLEDPKKDIEQRLKLVSTAADQLYDMATDTRDDPTCLHVMLVPEFFFRGKNGAYAATGDRALMEHGVKLVRDIAGQAKFANWLFVCGTTIESDLLAASSDIKTKAKLREELTQAIVRSYNNEEANSEAQDFLFKLLSETTEFAQSHPLVTVRNRCFVYKQNWPEWPNGVRVEKRFVSHEDFVVSYYQPGAYSEMSVAYPYVDESSGELKKDASDEKSIFQVDGTMIALEICLDHRRARLRQVRKTNEESNVPVDMHLVVSCGMQIQQPSVVARKGGVVFNCDGQYAKPSAGALPDATTCLFTGTKDGKAHSQMTVVATEASADRDAKCELPPVSVQTAPLRIPDDSSIAIEQLEACGAGEVHLYSKYPLPS